LINLNNYKNDANKVDQKELKISHNYAVCEKFVIVHFDQLK